MTLRFPMLFQPPQTKQTAHLNIQPETREKKMWTLKSTKAQHMHAYTIHTHRKTYKNCIQLEPYSVDYIHKGMGGKIDKLLLCISLPCCTFNCLEIYYQVLGKDLTLLICTVYQNRVLDGKEFVTGPPQWIFDIHWYFSIRITSIKPLCHTDTSGGCFNFLWLKKKSLYGRIMWRKRWRFNSFE